MIRLRRRLTAHPLMLRGGTIPGSIVVSSRLRVTRWEYPWPSNLRVLLDKCQDPNPFAATNDGLGIHVSRMVDRVTPGWQVAKSQASDCPLGLLQRHVVPSEL